MKTRLLIVIACLLSACSYTPEGITPVRDFEADKYLGTWYEIARLDHSFERGLEPLAFDALALIGLLVSQLVNALTAEYLAAGVGAVAMLLYLMGAWVIIAGDAADAVATERRRFPRSARGALGAHPRRALGAPGAEVPSR